MPETNARHSQPQRELDQLMHATRAVGVGVYDGLSTLLASRHAFDFLWVSGFSVSASLGLPDVGIIGPDEVLEVVRTARRVSSRPIVVDMDAGYGDAVKLHHVARDIVRAGATALCIEDNPVSKRCSLYDNVKRTLVTADEHCGRIRAARQGVLAAALPAAVVARTEALVAGLGLDAALERCHAYVAAGADAVFVQTVDPTGQEIIDFAGRWRRRTPILVTPTRYPKLRKADLFKAGISHVIYANQAVRAAHAAITEVFSSLARASSSIELEARITPVAQLAVEVGKDHVEELEQQLFEAARAVRGDEPGWARRSDAGAWP